LVAVLGDLTPHHRELILVSTPMTRILTQGLLDASPLLWGVVLAAMAVVTVVGLLKRNRR
jgi:hypothetical protein